MAIDREENPFEQAEIAQQWINSVEQETGSFRDQWIYPRLRAWIQTNNPALVCEMGAGQGICSDKIPLLNARYIGIEPSIPLVKRACQLYQDNRRYFVVGTAYETPIVNECLDACFSVNVWYHLQHLAKAAHELKRILKPDGRFLIITANPASYPVWEAWFFDCQKVGNKLIGQVEIPVNPLSRSVFYLHPFKEIMSALNSQQLLISNIETFAVWAGEEIFMEITGSKR